MATNAFICPYCGRKIDENNILFVYDGFPSFYTDTTRYNFLMKCSSQWPFENGDRFRGLYFHPIPENTRYVEPNHIPVVTTVRLSSGMTPIELADPDKLNITGEEKPEPNDDPVAISSRACPHCHCRLPNNYGIYPTMFVSMMGGRAAGKTAFLLSMIHQLPHQLPARGLGSAKLHSESQIFYNLQNNYYQQNNGVTLPTPKEERLFPFVFEYTYFNNAVTKNCFIVIYDIAGEGMEQPDYLLGHLGIKQAKTVLLMLDPNMLSSGGYDAAIRQQYNELQQSDDNAAELPEVPMFNVESHDFYDAPLHYFLASTVVSTRNLGVLNDVRNVIAVTTKMDQPLRVDAKRFGGDCILKDDLGKAHWGALDLDVIRHVHRDVCTFYNAKSGIQLVDAVRSAYSGGDGDPVNVFALAVSTYTRAPGSSLIFTNSYQEMAPKHRIVEPFLMLLHLAGMIPATNANAEAASSATGTSAKAQEPVKEKKHGLFGRRK